MIATKPAIRKIDQHGQLILPPQNKVILNTAERVSAFSDSDNYIFSRPLFAYLLAQEYVRVDVVELGCGEGYAIPMISGNASRYIAIDKNYPGRMAASFPENVEFIKMKTPPLNYSADLLFKLLKKQFNKIEINGIKGDAVVNKYYEQNKISVDRIKKYDCFNLENKLPATFMRIPYDILNRFNRISLSRRTHFEFTPSNFHLSDDLSNSLDFFVVARKD